MIKLQLTENEDQNNYAEFDLREDGGAVLTRWPRLRKPAVIPASVEGHPVVRIAVTAFAPYHISDKLFSESFYSPYSINMLAMKLGRRVVHEEQDEGGPTEIEIPDSVTEIGAYAFWHCQNLKKLRIPDGVRELPTGCFGECSFIEEIQLSAQLEAIGIMPRITDQIMPDIGAFYCCHELKKLTLPAGVKQIGAYSFNSCGIRDLAFESRSAEKNFGTEDKTEARTNRMSEEQMQVHRTAFDHAAALQWMDRTEEDGRIRYRIGLPPARDTILNADPIYGQLSHIPVDFFIKDVGWFDELARKVFRVDFSARMALGRLQYDEALLPENRTWYIETLVNYYTQAVLFMPEKKDAFEKLFEILEQLPDLTADHVSRLVYAAGELHLSPQLISHMIEVRTKRFSSVTGMEDLELDF